MHESSLPGHSTLFVYFVEMDNPQEHGNMSSSSSVVVVSWDAKGLTEMCKGMVIAVKRQQQKLLFSGLPSFHCGIP